MTKILAIDDILDNLIVINALLKKLIPDCTIITALNGREGIELAIREKPDTILLDIQMPEMNGFEVCEALKKHPVTKQIPVVMLTAMYKDAESKIKALDLGADAFLAKPIDKGELVAQINAMLRIKRAEDSLRDERDNLEQLVAERTAQVIESEKKYRSFFEDDLTADFIIDAEGQIEDCNPAFIKMFRFPSKEEALKHNFFELYQSTTEKNTFVEHIIDKGLLRNYQLCMKRRDGSVIFVQENARAVMDNNEQLHKIQGYIVDETAKRNSENALLAQDKVNQVVADISRQILMPDLSVERIATVILDAVQMLCNSPHGFVTTIDKDTFENIVHTFDHSGSCSIPHNNIAFKRGENGYSGLWGVALNERKAFFTNEPANHPASSGAPAGHIALKSFLSVPAIANNLLLGQIAIANTPNGYTTTDLDVVERIANLYALAILRKKTEAELIQAKEKAEESDKLKSSFLANLSHEIRTPLNGIMGFSQLLANSGLSIDKIPPYTEIILSSAKQLLGIITDILDISQIDSGLIKIRKTNVNLHSLLTDLFTEFVDYKDRHGKHNIALHLKEALPQAQSIIYTDEQRLRQIVVHLLTNAVKFTEEGEIEFGYVINKNRSLLFYVKDTGVGVAEDKQTIIFERFRQEDESHTRRFGGTGLGLSIAKNLTEFMGGEMWVNSEKGKGAAFYFTVVDALLVKNEEETETDDENGYNWLGSKILIVDDTATICEYLEEIISPTGAQCLTARNGREAVDIFVENRDIKLILMDIQMPIMNGYEAKDAIRAIGSDVHIIAQTAYGVLSEGEDKLKNFTDYVSKPINRHELLPLINKYLKE